MMKIMMVGMMIIIMMMPMTMMILMIITTIIRQASGQGRAEITYQFTSPTQAIPGGDYKLAYSPPYLPGRT